MAETYILLYGWYCMDCSDKKDDYPNERAAKRGADQHDGECEARPKHDA